MRRIEVNKTIPLRSPVDVQLGIEKFSTALGAALTARTKVNRVRLEVGFHLLLRTR